MYSTYIMYIAIYTTCTIYMYSIKKGSQGLYIFFKNMVDKVKTMINKRINFFLLQTNSINETL